MATSCFLCFQLSHYFPFPPSSSSSCQSGSCTSYAQTKREFRGIGVPMAACSHQENSSQHFLPPLGLRPNALVPIKEGKVKKTAAHTQNNEIERSSFAVISLMLGLLLGYALSLKERAAVFEVIITMRKKLKELKDQISVLRSNHGNQNAMKDLESGIPKILVELFEASKLLKNRLDDDDEQHKVETLARELKTAKEDLQKSDAKLQELKTAMKDGLIMHRKLGVVQKKLNAAEKDLNVEKMLVSSLKDDVQLLENQVEKERKLRRSLYLNMKETTKSIELMKHKVEFLSNQLTSFRSCILKLQKLLADERRTLKQTQKNLEDAQNQIKKLGQGRKDLERE